MTELFYVANSFAAPICSDQSTGYTKGSNVENALAMFLADYKHPAGLYSANFYPTADDYHKGGKSIAKWRCNVAIAIERASPTSLRTVQLSEQKCLLEMDGKEVTVHLPYDGEFAFERSKGN